MRIFPVSFPAFLAAAGFAAALSAQARADLAYNFATMNPLMDSSVLVQGPDAANVNNRFIYNSGAGTLTAHYDSTAPTIKLVFPMPGNQQFTQNDSFKVTTIFTILSAGFVSPPDFGGPVSSFGLVNSTATGNVRASTADADFNEVTQGNAYDLMTFDYFPTQDPTFGGNSVNLTTIQTQQPATTFNDNFFFGYDNANLPFDQPITATFDYDAPSQQATLDWGTGSLQSNLTGAIFDMDSFAITLWNDPNLTATDPAVPAGSPTGGDVAFDSFSVQTVPEPASLATLAAGMLLLVKRRR